MLELRSYVGGRWVAGTGAAQTLLNPTTEEPLARASSEGVDLKAALDYARSTGGPALRAMSFAERGAALKAIADAIQTERERLLELGIANGGNTRSDAKFDVDGAIATLLAYAETALTLGFWKIPRRRRRHPARPLGALSRPAHLGAAPRRRGSHQCVQLSRLGVRRKGGGGAARRHACAEQARHQLGAPRPPHHGGHRREEAASRGRALLPRRRRARPGRASRRAGRARLYRLRRNGGANTLLTERDPRCRACEHRG